jgi:hypothetical protein
MWLLTFDLIVSGPKNAGREMKGPQRDQGNKDPRQTSDWKEEKESRVGRIAVVDAFGVFAADRPTAPGVPKQKRVKDPDFREKE